MIAMALALLGPGLADAQPDQGLSGSAFKEQLRNDLGADFVTPAIEAMPRSMCRRLRSQRRWPLEGSCTVSGSQIECRTNDAIGGFAMSASF